MKKLLHILFSRVVIVGVSILIQAFAYFGVLWYFGNYFVYFYAICLILSIAVVIYIVNGKSNPAYKIAWIIPIMVFPIFGGLFYLMFGSTKNGRHSKKKLSKIKENYLNVIHCDTKILEQLEKQDISIANQSRYINNYADAPIYQNTSSEYLTPGEKKFDRLKLELVKAKRYIFIEYFIIQEGIMWNSILDILVQKVKEGVDVRVIYDDVGCLFTLPYGYDKKLEKMGIKCSVFNPFVPVLSLRLNNRDHRKICVIDGHTAFTGGINLADEYINAYVKYGHWKDSSIVLQGDAVWSFTLIFLSLWDYTRNITEDYEQFRPYPEHIKDITSDGYVQPYTDSPLDNESVGESIYMNMINSAKHYVYITTPYLILDNEMITSLNLAAKRGVDVRIITPRIPDKWYVHPVTRANYDILIECGVKIYEYTPGFIHSKTFVVDDELAVVGTTNLDYRSLYLHFECGVWLYKTKSVLEVKDDFIKTLEVSEKITLENHKKLSWLRRLGCSLLRILAPLM